MDLLTIGEGAERTGVAPSALRFYETKGLIHSERLYMLLLELAGDLSTFAREGRRPMEYPVYDHDDPQACFMPLMTDLRRSWRPGAVNTNSLRG